MQQFSKVRLSRCIHESTSFGGAVALAQGSLCLPPSTTPRQSLMDTRGRSPLYKRRRFTKGGALVPTIEPVYPVDPPEQPQQQQPQSRIQRQNASEDLTQSLGLDSHQQPQPQPQPQSQVQTSRRPVRKMRPGRNAGKGSWMRSRPLRKIRNNTV